MDMLSNAIKELLPHREPFLFVDEIISATKDEIVAINTFSSENKWLKNSFPNHQYVPGTILIESIAQSGGAAIRKLGIAQGAFALTSIENVVFYKGIEFDKRITFVIKNIRISDKIIKQSGMAYVEEQLAMEGNWMSIKMVENK